MSLHQSKLPSHTGWSGSSDRESGPGLSFLLSNANTLETCSRLVQNCFFLHMQLFCCATLLVTFSLLPLLCKLPYSFNKTSSCCYGDRLISYVLFCVHVQVHSQNITEASSLSKAVCFFHCATEAHHSQQHRGRLEADQPAREGNVQQDRGLSCVLETQPVNLNVEWQILSPVGQQWLRPSSRERNTQRLAQSAQLS